MSEVALKKELNPLNLMNFDKEGLKDFFVSLGEPSYRGEQVFQWIHQRGVLSPDDMTNISKACKEKLHGLGEIAIPKVVKDQLSTDGTRKWLLELMDGNAIEMVHIPEEGRGTLCISSQVGCALNCRFCSTGMMGFNRNLSAAEIIGQLWLARKLLGDFELKENKHVTNVVMMGMGEPLLNYESVVTSMDIMMDDYAYGLSKYRVTLSTSGVVPKMLELAKDSKCSLAVSLHAANDPLRDVLVPINKKYPVKVLMDACRKFFKDEPNRQVTFEYTMLKDTNDKLEHAHQLVKMVKNVPCKINLIPFNPFPRALYECSEWDDILAFQKVLQNAGLNVMIRKTRGDDISAACGQLVGDFTDKTKRSERLLAS